MRCAVSSYWLPKGGHPVEEYEDAFFPRRTGTRTGPKLRLAVADGASESMLSGLWADQLVRSWCRRRRPMDEAVEQAMAGWRATLGTYLAGRVAEHRPIAWFERPGLERGAHATLLGIDHNLQYLSPELLKLTRQLFDVQAMAITRGPLTGVWGGWEHAGAEDVRRFLARWEHSSLDLLRMGHASLLQLVLMAWYARPQAWAHCGYPGPPLV